MAASGLHAFCWILLLAGSKGALFAAPALAPVPTAINSPVQAESTATPAERALMAEIAQLSTEAAVRRLTALYGPPDTGQDKGRIYLWRSTEVPGKYLTLPRHGTTKLQIFTLSVTTKLDIAALWDYQQPALSAERFEAAKAGASPDEVLILQSQTARSHGLRGDFPQARSLLAAMAPEIAHASVEARTYYELELGRSYASATHPAAAQTSETKAEARRHYLQALALAKQGQLDNLAIDALHMMAFVDTAPADQLHWADEALVIATASGQPKARKWEASLRNNKGYALHELGRYEEALTEFKVAQTLREQGNNASAERVARWMVAWTLRALKRNDEALAMQLQLEKDCDAAGEPDPEVYAELMLLYEAHGDDELARHYRELKARTPA